MTDLLDRIEQVFSMFSFTGVRVLSFLDSLLKNPKRLTPGLFEVEGLRRMVDGRRVPTLKSTMKKIVNDATLPTLLHFGLALPNDLDWKKHLRRKPGGSDAYEAI